MNYDEEAYQNAVNTQFEKLGDAETPEEIQAVLDIWPRREDYCKNEDEEDKDE